MNKKILLIAIDSKIQNLALEKIKKYYTIKKLIYNKLKELEIEESKIKEIIQFIADIMDRCWIKMA